MAKPKVTWKMVNYGMYDNWNKNTKELPSFRKFTTEIPARLDIEFGYILNIKKARGKKLHICIEHPPFTDEDGKLRPSFTGELYIRTNDWNFFLGDTIWAPVADKIGTWRLITTLEGVVLADKSFAMVVDDKV